MTDNQRGSLYMVTSMAGFAVEDMFIKSAARNQTLGAAVFGIVGYSFLTRAMRTGEVCSVTPFRYTRLLFAMVLGVTLFGEQPDLLTLVGSAMIVC
jgi:drug/metabolite transporter (DMT)-like permease